MFHVKQALESGRDRSGRTARFRKRADLTSDCGALTEHRAGSAPHTARAIIIFLISAMAFAGFNPLGQVLAQFMMVWQR